MWLLDNLAQTLIAVGLALLIIEVLILGFATFVLFFLGLSLVITGTAMWAELLSADITTALWSNAVLCAVLAAALWKPLKKMQQQTQKEDVKSDFAELIFTLEQDVDKNGHSQHLYSGIQWQLKSQQPISQGTEVKVVKKEVGVLWVEPV